VLYATTVEGNNNRLITITDIGGASVEDRSCHGWGQQSFPRLGVRPVPELRRFALLGFGVAGLLVSRRRKN